MTAGILQIFSPRYVWLVGKSRCAAGWASGQVCYPQHCTASLEIHFWGIFNANSFHLNPRSGPCDVSPETCCWRRQTLAVTVGTGALCTPLGVCPGSAVLARSGCPSPGGSAGSSGHSKAMLEPVSVPTSYEYLLCVKEQSWCGREQEMGQLLNPRSSACGRGCSFERGQAVARHLWWGPGGSACCGRTASRLLSPFPFITLANCVLLPLVREKTQVSFPTIK